MRNLQIQLLVIANLACLLRIGCWLWHYYEVQQCVTDLALRWSSFWS